MTSQVKFALPPPAVLPYTAEPPMFRTTVQKMTP